MNEEFDRFEELMAKDESHLPVAEQSLIFRLRKRAEIRRQITSRKSVEEGKPDRIADLLEEAAAEIERINLLYSNLERLNSNHEQSYEQSHEQSLGQLDVDTTSQIIPHQHWSIFNKQC